MAGPETLATRPGELHSFMLFWNGQWTIPKSHESNKARSLMRSCHAMRPGVTKPDDERSRAGTISLPFVGVSWEPEALGWFRLDK